LNLSSEVSKFGPFREMSRKQKSTPVDFNRYEKGWPITRFIFFLFRYRI
jgi:hypothetical protein